MAKIHSAKFVADRLRAFGEVAYSDERSIKEINKFADEIESVTDPNTKKGNNGNINSN